eukprot:15315693-Alexandrium_andersonii.AAC.1
MASRPPPPRFPPQRARSSAAGPRRRRRPNEESPRPPPTAFLPAAPARTPRARVASASARGGCRSNRACSK